MWVRGIEMEIEGRQREIHDGTSVGRTGKGRVLTDISSDPCVKHYAGLNNKFFSLTDENIEAQRSLVISSDSPDIR